MDYMITTDEGSEYLSHHGVLGMKWGVRHRNVKDGRRTFVREQKENNSQYQNNVMSLKNQRSIAVKQAKLESLKNQRSIAVKQAKLDYRNGLEKERNRLNDKENSRIQRYGETLKENGHSAGRSLAGSVLSAVGGLTLARVASSATLAATQNAGLALVVSGTIGSVSGYVSGNKFADAVALASAKNKKK